jgi:hypothetical protein
MHFGEHPMTTIESSELLIAEVRKAIEEDRQLFEIPSVGILYKGPNGGFERKAIFVPPGNTVEEKKAACLKFATFLREKNIPIRIWHELLDSVGALIIDKPTVTDLEKLHDYSPD